MRVNIVRECMFMAKGMLFALAVLTLLLLNPVSASAQTFGKGFLDEDSPSTDEEIEFQNMTLEEKMKLFERLSAEEKLEIFGKLEPPEKYALFSKISDTDKKIIFERLEETEKITLLEKMSESEKKMLFGALDDADIRLLFDSLTVHEKKQWLSLYPNLSLIIDPEEIADLTPSREADKEEEKAEPSQLESILSGDFPIDISRELKQFGYDYFQKADSLRQPSINVPVGDEYVFGPGDHFSVYLWGKVEKKYKVSVSNEGVIVIPRLGSLEVGGLSLKETRVLLENRFKEFYPEFQMSITMEKLRVIQVFVIGEVLNPGAYTVSSLSTAISALFEAGGPNKNGSLRNIRIIRNTSESIHIDLYDFFILGEKKNDVRLNAGDTVFVPLIGPVVGVAGKVRRPAIYEMKPGETLQNVLRYAGGILPFGYLQNVVIERIEGNRRRITKSFNLDSAAVKQDADLLIPLLDGDVIKVYPIHQQMQQVVYLEGHVKYPREFEHRPGLRLKDVLPSFDVLLPETYLPRAEIIRLSKPNRHPEIIPFNIGALMNGDDQQNLPLEELDRIRVYGRAEKVDLPEVSIDGAVRIPGTYRLLEGMTVKDLIFKAGNVADSAYLNDASLLRISPGEVKTETVDISFSPARAMAGLLPDNMTLRPHDSIYIREIPKYNYALTRKVLLEGEFVFPGEYPFSEGERISSVIKRAGGLTAHAYPFGAMLLREDVKESQQSRTKDYISNLEEDILTLTSKASEVSMEKEEADILAQTLKAKKQLLEKMKTAKPTGRMVVDVEKVLAMPNSDYDLRLMPGDHLIIGKKPDYINVLGEVYNPTALMVVKGKTVNYYLDRVGGATDSADEKQMYLVKANGTVISKKQEGYLGTASWDSENNRWSAGGFNSIVLDPGDTIIVPKKVERYPWLRVFKGVTEIAFQIAVVAGVLMAAGG